MTNQEIKSIIDSCIGKDIDFIEQTLTSLFNELIPYVLHDYTRCRTTLQFVIGQLERLHTPATICMFANVLNSIPRLQSKFQTSHQQDNSYINIDWEYEEVKDSLDIAYPLHNANPYLHILNHAIADALSPAQRRKLVSCIIHSIQYFGTSSQWDKNTLENHRDYLSFLYSICKKDSQMWYLFHYAKNFIDRLASSNEAQAARDIAETILMIGYQEGMEAEGYLCAAQAYTVLRNPLAGLLYLLIALHVLVRQPQQLSYKASFGLLWLVIKIARGIQFYSEEALTPILRAFKALQPSPYDETSFYHTYLSLIFFDKGDKVLDNIADFLDKNREYIYSHLDHSALPWITLIFTVRLNFPEANLGRLKPYIGIFKSVLDRKGNEILLDFFDGINLDTHLKELMIKLQSTRNIEDYSHDNYYASLLAKEIIRQAHQQQDPGKFVLAMQVRADFTFVRPYNQNTELYGQMKFKDIDGKDYNLLIEDLVKLEGLMQQGDSTQVLWLGKTSSGVYGMSLLRNQFHFNFFESLSKINIDRIQSETIAEIRYSRSIQKKDQPIYIKDITELEDESISLKETLKDARIHIIDGADRLILVKDMDLAAYPHQLLIDDTRNEFIGQLLPTCNIISTEVLIKTNFEQPLSRQPICSFWYPIGCEEFTFEVINHHLEDIFEQYHFAHEYQGIPENPIQAEINVVCAHGGKDISDTQWFYADEKPIVETNKIVGPGKLLILFVCHSGSITRPDYDNAMHTLIKRYIRMGYSSVIAPMWSLNTEILPVWMSTFMDRIMNGQYVIDALYSANMAVKEEYISPAAYACLHLFGNPFLQIADQPIFTIEE